MEVQLTQGESSRTPTPAGVVQSVLFDKNIYSYGEAIRWMIFEGYLRYKAFGITSQYLRFKFLEPDETKYNYRRENSSSF